MPTFRLDPLRDPRWPEFVNHHPLSSIFHTTGWLRALHLTYGFEPVAVTTSAPDQELANAIVLCRVKSWLTGNRLVSLPFSDHCQPLVQTPEDLRELLEFLRQIQMEEAWKYVELRPLVELPTQARQSARFVGGASYSFHNLDLRPSLTSLMASFHKDCIQRQIRRAKCAGLAIEEGRSEQLLQRFYQLQLQTRRRQKLPPQPYAWFSNLACCLGERMTILLASLSSTPLAAILVLLHKDQMTYKYGCRNGERRSQGATQLLLWRAIQEAKSLNCDYLDMGRSDHENSGLITFKSRWGAPKSVLNYLTYPARTPLPAPTIKYPMLRSILSHLPDSVLSLAGSLLYPHLA